jgi:hypothetical protein
MLNTREGGKEEVTIIDWFIVVLLAVGLLWTGRMIYLLSPKGRKRNE